MGEWTVAAGIDVVMAQSPKADGGAIALGLGFIGFSSAIILFRYRETAHDGTFGATTIVAAMLAFALGAFAVLGDVRAAAATGVVVAVLLALKAVLHDWVKRLTWTELRSGLVLLAMTCIFCLRQIEFVGPDLSTMRVAEKRRIRRQLSFSMTVQSEVNDEKV